MNNKKLFKIHFDIFLISSWFEVNLAIEYIFGFKIIFCYINICWLYWQNAILPNYKDQIRETRILDIGLSVEW